MTKPLLWLVHPNKTEAPVREKELGAIGYRVIYRNWSSPEISRVKADPPAAVVIDLSRTPSVGRDAAIAMRSHRVMLGVPFILMGGTPETIAGVRKFLPDAIASEWPRIKAAVARAIKDPPAGARLLSVFVAYKDTPLAKKLGIKEGGIVAMRDAPRGLKEKIGELPAGAKLIRHGDARRDLTMWFVPSCEVLADEIASMKRHAISGGLWICWNKNLREKKLTQQIVRKTGLDAGLVDFKITRIDDDWAGLRFTIRK